MIPATRNIGEGSTIITTTDNILNINTTLGSATLTLPSITEWFELKNKSGAIYDSDGLRWTDVGGHAATNNITFVAAAGELINGASSLVINTNRASGIITPTLDADGLGSSAWEISSVGTPVSPTTDNQIWGGNYTLSSQSITQSQFLSFGALPLNARNIDLTTNQLTSFELSLSGLTSLINFSVGSNQLTSFTPSLTGLTSLENFDLGQNKLTSFTQSLSGLTSVKQINLGQNQLTSFTSSLSGLTSLTEIDLNNNNLPQSNIDSILADAVASASSIAQPINLYLDGGANAIPSSAGLADKATLIGLGWTVTTN